MISYNFSLVMKLILFILLPIVLVVLFGLFWIDRYSKKNKNSDFYTYTMEYYASLLAMAIVGILLAVVAGFSISFTQTMRIKDIVLGNEDVYYILMFIPMVPLTFLLYYIRKFIAASSGRKNTLATVDEE